MGAILIHFQEEQILLDPSEERSTLKLQAKLEKNAFLLE